MIWVKCKCMKLKNLWYVVDLNLFIFFIGFFLRVKKGTTVVSKLHTITFWWIPLQILKNLNFQGFPFKRVRSFLTNAYIFIFQKKLWMTPKTQNRLFKFKCAYERVASKSLLPWSYCSNNPCPPILLNNLKTYQTIPQWIAMPRNTVLSIK